MAKLERTPPERYRPRLLAEASARLSQAYDPGEERRLLIVSVTGDDGYSYTLRLTADETDDVRNLLARS